MQHRKSPPVPHDVAVEPARPADRSGPTSAGRRWFAIAWISLLFLVHGWGLRAVLSELNDWNIHDASIGIGTALLAVLPLVVKIGCLSLIVMRRRAGWYGYVLTAVVLMLLFTLANAGPQVIGWGFLIALVTTWLLWVAIAPQWESFR